MISPFLTAILLFTGAVAWATAPVPEPAPAFTSQHFSGRFNNDSALKRKRASVFIQRITQDQGFATTYAVIVVPSKNLGVTVIEKVNAEGNKTWHKLRISKNGLITISKEPSFSLIAVEDHLIRVIGQNECIGIELPAYKKSDHKLLGSLVQPTNEPLRFRQKGISYKKGEYVYLEPRNLFYSFSDTNKAHIVLNGVNTPAAPQVFNYDIQPLIRGIGALRPLTKDEPGRSLVGWAAFIRKSWRDKMLIFHTDAESCFDPVKILEEKAK